MPPAAKPRTYAQARAALFREFADAGWEMSSPKLLTLHATSPDGRARAWFKPQAVYYTNLDSPTQQHSGRHEVGNGHTVAYDLDIRKLPPGVFVRWFTRNFWHADTKATRTNPTQRIPAGMTVEWLPANQAWIVLSFGRSPSNLGTGRGNYYPTKTELKRDLATLGLRLAGNRIVAAENRTNPTVDVTSLSEAEFVKKTKIGKRYSTQSGRRFARVSDKAGLFTTDVIVREREDAPEEKDATKIKLRAYAQLRVGTKGHTKANPRTRRNFIPLVAAAAPAAAMTVARILPYLIQAREVACTSGGRMAIQKALDTVCIGKTGQTTAPVAAPGIKTNPLVKYRGHVVIGTRGLYTVAPYDQTFSSLADAKRWLDGHVARESAKG